MRIEENETQRENIDAIVIRNVSWLKISCLKWEDPDSMKYTISEMASLLGVTTHMLRHYEKMGIISPEVNEQTGYRYYTVLDTRRFNLCRQLFSTGLSLETCAKLMHEMMPFEIERTLLKQMDRIRMESERLKIAQRYLQTQLDALPTLDNDVGRIYIEHHDPMWRLNLSDMEVSHHDKVLEAEKQQWLELMPATFWVSKIPHEELKQFSEGEIGYGYGLMCYEEDARKLGLRRTANVEIIPGGDYVVLLHCKADRGPFRWKDIQNMSEYLKKRGLAYFGDGYSYVVASQDKECTPVNYHKLIVKIFA